MHASGKENIELMKYISCNMSADMVRSILENVYHWDLEKMSVQEEITVAELSDLLQNGNEKKESVPSGKHKVSYDLLFSLMAGNLEMEVTDPHELSDEQLEKLIQKAAEQIVKRIMNGELGENLTFARTYMVDGKEDVPFYLNGQQEFPGYDPQIVIEITQMCYPRLYSKYNDGALVAGIIGTFCAELTEKYKNTDWQDGENDFWLTMEEEADNLLAEHDICEDQDDEEETDRQVMLHIQCDYGHVAESLRIVANIIEEDDDIEEKTELEVSSRCCVQRIDWDYDAE